MNQNPFLKIPLMMNRLVRLVGLYFQPHWMIPLIVIIILAIMILTAVIRAVAIPVVVATVVVDEVLNDKNRERKGEIGKEDKNKWILKMIVKQ